MRICLRRYDTSKPPFDCFHISRAAAQTPLQPYATITRYPFQPFLPIHPSTKLSIHLPTVSIHVSTKLVSISAILLPILVRRQRGPVRPAVGRGAPAPGRPGCGQAAGLRLHHLHGPRGHLAAQGDGVSSFLACYTCRACTSCLDVFGSVKQTSAGGIVVCCAHHWIAGSTRFSPAFDCLSF